MKLYTTIYLFLLYDYTYLKLYFLSEDASYMSTAGQSYCHSQYFPLILIKYLKDYLII